MQSRYSARSTTWTRPRDFPRSYCGSAAKSGLGAMRQGASSNWNRVQQKMDIPNVKKPELEFRKLVMQLTNKSGGRIEAMERRLTKRNIAPRPKTEFELMKERLKHVEFSDEEKGFLTKDQMETITQKIGDAKKSLMELEREAKSKGKQLNTYILDYKDWSEEVEFLRSSGLGIDMDSLLQARKRILVRDLFYDPEEAERRRQAAELAAKLAKERVEALERKKKEAEEEKLKALDAERERLKKEQEEKERRLREEEERKLAENRREEEEIERYAEQERRKLELERMKGAKQEEETRAKRTGLLRKFSTTDIIPPEGPDVGKLKFEQSENDQKGRRRSVGKLNNPFEAGLETQTKTQKQRARRASKVGKLNSPFEAGISENEGPSWSKASSRNASRGCSRRGSNTNIETTPFTQQPDFMEALAGLEDLAARAAEAFNDD
ncbi:uncharacterized protein LOC134818931 [Bolinopsis microptera]|uniref:uncharacterized protein LOC134818931 n=1 Tax=Bolinopsis microptera TaxID=2820187 RepID=UPI00307AE4F3